MADQQEEDDLRMALRMSMQNLPPEPKRSKPREAAISPATKTPEEDSRRFQRELMAAAAEKRMMAAATSAPSSSSPSKNARSGDLGIKEAEMKSKEINLGNELSEKEAYNLFSIVFGSGVSKDILAQWSNQGIRFSSDPETSMGLVQHEGGPCGVLAAIQAFVLKHLLFFPEDLGKVAANMPQNLSSRRSSKSQYVASNNFSAFTEDAKTRALVKSMSEILFLCGNNKRAVIATLSVVADGIEGSEGSPKDVIIAQVLEDLSIESASDLQKVLRVDTFTSPTNAFKRLEAMVPIFQSRVGALLFLISALLSRGLDCVQANRDDPSLPLVTAPFGHASQEIVNLLLCGQAVPNVFDGRMDFGGGMFLKGIPTSVELFKMRMNWKKGNHRSGKPLMPRIRVEAVALSVWKLSIKYSGRQVSNFHPTNLIAFAARDSLYGMGRKIFDLYHFNGIAKSDLNGSQAGDVAVPPGTAGSESSGKDAEVAKLEQPPQHAPLADCIRTRWPRAVCNWIGDPPSIV
ncbi:hypothetical protein like AT1G43690 [Hibiscus trionum]|uniref:Deubiquitinating enzyme MINDY-3/4 conserved domain-containing protein n=1 Tax=Hibiscus trionum TaxID=183268 RepID=A0A9W7HU11_HIBTR|nr:hypothetical protein like AT1G43690 [Hibiscus trionum]